MLCLECQKETKNKKFCSRACANHYNNRNGEHAKLQGKCIICDKPISKSKRACPPCQYSQEYLSKYKVRTQTQEMNLQCKCRFCGREYIYTGPRRGFTKSKCNSCMVNKRKNKIKKMCLEYKGDKCERCGYNKCKRALNFHHLDPSNKKFGISGAHARSWESIKEELDKCIILCANCHMEVHDEKNGADHYDSIE